MADPEGNEPAPADQPDGAGSNDVPAQPASGASIAGGRADDGGEYEADSEEQRRGALVINNILGDIHSAETTFGGARPVRAATGRLPENDVDDALRHYVEPASDDTAKDPYGAAAKILADRRIVVLVGPDGIGRYAGALSLLRKHTDPRQPLTALSPAMPMAELAEYKFRDGRGYLVADRIVESAADAVQTFNLKRVVANLDKAKAYLVITANPRSVGHAGLAGFATRWHSPPPMELFNKCVEVHPLPPMTDADRDRVDSHVQSLPSPKDVVDLAKSLAVRGIGALDELDDPRRAKVSAWFKAVVDWDELLVVAALAFTHGLPERQFEELHANLRKIDQTDGVPHAKANPDKVPLLQVRRVLDDGTGLVTRRQDSTPAGDLLGGERRVVFESPEMLEHVLAELHECGYALWKPLRIWIHELAAMPSSDVQVRLALGVAMLARTSAAAPEVEEFLETWSNGPSAERFTAAYTLACMTGDDTMALAALRIALRWAGKPSSKRALTAALALGGPLGNQYPSEAVSWLWHLATKSARIRAVAARSLALMLCAADNDLEAAAKLLRRLLLRLRHTLEARGELRHERAAMDTVLTVLAVQHFDRREPMVAAVLRGHPPAAATVGALWAEVLRSLPHRSDALLALLATMEALADDAAIPVVQAMGEAFRDELTAAELRLLQRDLTLTYQYSADETESHRRAVAALLGALAGRPVQPVSAGFKEGE